MKKILAFAFDEPIIILEGKRLSFTLHPSLKNSGEKIIFFVWCFLCIFSVKPTGTVDLITIRADLFILLVSWITSSTIDVSKLLFFSLKLVGVQTITNCDFFKDFL